MSFRSTRLLLIGHALIQWAILLFVFVPERHERALIVAAVVLVTAIGLSLGALWVWRQPTVIAKLWGYEILADVGRWWFLLLVILILLGREYFLARAIAGRLSPFRILLYVQIMLAAATFGSLWWEQRQQSTPTWLSALLAKVERGLERAPIWVLAGLLSIIPSLLVFALIRLHLNSDITSFMPHEWNDQVTHWHQISTFAAHGLNGGYYVWDEIAGPSPIIRFSVHGPTQPILYGLLAHLIGWERYTPILVHLVMLPIALWGTYLLIGLRRPQLVLATVVLSTLWGISLYIPTSSPEPLHQSIAIVLGGIFYLLIARKGEVSLAVKLAGFFLLILASLLRISWAPLFIPYLMLANKRRTPITLIGAIIAGLIAGAAVQMVWRSVLPPSGNVVFELMGDIQRPSAVLAGISGLIRDNFGVMERNPLVYNICIQILIGALFGLFMLYRSWAEKQALNEGRWAEGAFHLYNLGTILAASLLIYLARGYLRVMTPHLIIAVIVMIGSKHYRPVMAILLISLLSIPAFLRDFGAWYPNFHVDQAEIELLDTSLQQNMIYDAHTDNAWCNTVLISLDLYDGRVTSVPAGFGISTIVLKDNLSLPLKSRFLLFSESSAYLLPDLNIQKLTDVAGATLYYNRDSGCALLD